MDLLTTLKEQWPLLAIAAWFAYKWWSSRRVVRLLPELKSKGAVLVDVRSVEEFASNCPKVPPWCCAAPAVPAAAWQKCCSNAMGSKTCTTLALGANYFKRNLLLQQ